MSGIEVTPFVDASSLAQGKLIIVEMVDDKDGVVAYLQNLLHKERTVHPACQNYLAKVRAMALASDIEPVNEKWRRKLCEWCYEVTDHFKCKYFFDDARDIWFVVPGNLQLIHILFHLPVFVSCEQLIVKLYRSLYITWISPPTTGSIIHRHSLRRRNTNSWRLLLSTWP